MAVFIKFDPFAEAVAEKVHNLGADVLKVMLSNTAPLTTNAVKADITEIAAGNGYTAGGSQAVITSSSQTGGVYKLVLEDVVFTASGGSVGPFRYSVLYNSTTVDGNLIGYYDYGSSITLSSGQSFKVDFDPVNGALTLT